MHHLRTHLTRERVATIALAAIALTAGLVAMQLLQQRVAVLPGGEGCARLDDVASRTECFAAEVRGPIDTAFERVLTADAPMASLDDELRAIDTRASESRALGDMCHRVMHVVARDHAAQLAAGSAPFATPAHTSTFCASGYAHGLVEGYIEASGAALTSLEPSYTALCATAADTAACAHGLGHAAMRGNESVASERYQLCATLPPSHVDSCENGIFMEYAQRTDPPTTGADYVRSCESVPDASTQETCWYYYSGLLVDSQPLDEAISSCVSTVPAGYRDDCVEGVGRALQPEELNLCSSAKGQSAVQACVRGALGLSLESKIITEAEALEACTSLSAVRAQRWCSAFVVS